MRTALLLIGVGACGASEPDLPTYATQPTSALAEVPYPPPPARVEIVPPSPRALAVWIDGEWTWQIRRWAWKPGRWVAAPEGGRFAPWTYVRDRMGTLYFAAGTWRNAAGAEIPEPAPLAVAGRASATVVTPDGDPVAVAPTIPLVAVDASAPVDAGAGALDASPPIPNAATP